MNLDIFRKIFADRNPVAEKRRRLFFAVFVFAIWVSVQYFLGSKFYILFIAVFFILSILPRPPYYMFVIAAVLAAVLLSTSTLDTWMVLAQSNLNTIQEPASHLDNIFSPNSGKKVLPAQVRRMLSLLNTHKITSYQLSKKLYSHEETLQRITEAAWPIRMDNQSPYFLTTTEELTSNSTCTIIDSKKDIVLVYCN